jgi:hypothetical protein
MQNDEENRLSWRIIAQGIQEEVGPSIEFGEKQS